MRRRDYRCYEHGLFEYVDSMHDPVIEFLPCPTCGKPSKRQVAVPIIGKIYQGVHVTDFPGPLGPDGKPTRITMARDEVERRLAQEPQHPMSEEYFERTREQRAEKVERLIQQANSGTLPPPPEPTQEQVKLVTEALKNNG